jgi:hypothetical protein
MQGLSLGSGMTLSLSAATTSAGTRSTFATEKTWRALGRLWLWNKGACSFTDYSATMYYGARLSIKKQ